MRVTVNQAEFDKLPESEQRELEGMLAELAKALEENPLGAYFPHARQRPFHEAGTKIKAFIGGNRSGKTTAGVADDLIQALDTDWVPSHLRPYKKWEPPFKCRVITPDFGRTMEVVMEKLRDLTPRSQLKGGGFDKAYDKQNRVLRFQNGSLFDFMTHEQDIDKFGGVARHRIHYDEEPPQEIRTASAKRLIDYGGDEVFTFTPEMGISWTHRDIYEARDNPAICVVQCGMRDNPHLSSEEIDYLLSLIPTEEERRIAERGEYAAIGGIFYPEFSERLHVKDEDEETTRKRVKDQSVVVGIDPGYNTTACVWIAFDSENAAFVFDELYCEKQVPAEIVERIKVKSGKWGVKPSYVIDPSARNRATVNAEQVEGEFARAGIYCQHGQNARDAGILEVKRRLQKGELVVHQRCKTLRWEFPRYRRDPKGVDEWAAVKVDDHGLDAMRYALMSRAWHIPPEKLQRRKRSTLDYQAPYHTEQFIQPASPMGSFG